MPDDPAHDRITAILAAITELVTGEPSIPCVDIVDLRHVLVDTGRAVFGQAEADGPDRAIRAAEAAMDNLKRTLRQEAEEARRGSGFFITNR
jgi:cell division GTPase FtsZ